MKVRDALRNQLLRLVPLNEKGTWPAKYQGKKPILNFDKHLGEKMALYNTKVAFVFSKKYNDESSYARSANGEKTILFLNGADSSLYTDNNNKARGSNFIIVKVTEEFLNAEIPEVKKLESTILDFDNSIYKLINEDYQNMNGTEMVSLICDPHTYEIVSRDDVHRALGFVLPNNGGGDLAEIINHSSARARLLLDQRGRRLEHPSPDALNLFSKDSIVRKSVLLRYNDQSK